jgi:site-specific DNA recombinase
MRTYFAYIRVSTIKQGEKGSSLQEQKDAILNYGQKHGLHISEFFEEQQTAAKLGRAIFRRMLTRLKKGHAHGLIMHKVDRGARNLSDWAELATLMDLGIDVHFAHEAIDLQTRGGRLSADIQAVVASDYIRNLREEVKKGIYGRLKQGIYPFAAPPGYRDNGKAALKTIDPVQGPLVRETFEKYASGSFGLHSLRAHMNERGLRNSQGRPVHVSGLATMLHNTFYYGLLIVKGQSFLGAHEPLISKTLFDQCRAHAEGRLVSPTRVWGKAEYQFRQLVRCTECSRKLIAETQRGHVYYRCHSKQCKGTSIKEEMIAEEVNTPLGYLPLPPKLEAFLRKAFMEAQQVAKQDGDRRHAALTLQLGNLAAREQKLTDLYIDGSIESFDYQARRQSLHNEHIHLQAEISTATSLEQNDAKVEQFIEHAKALGNMAKSQNTHEIRQIVKSATSNILVLGKHIEIKWSGAFQMLIDIGGFPSSALDRKAARTCTHYITGSDITNGQCPKCVTEYDQMFKERLKEKSEALYLAIISDERLQKRSFPIPDDHIVSPML